MKTPNRETQEAMREARAMKPSHRPENEGTAENSVAYDETEARAYAATSLQRHTQSVLDETAAQLGEARAELMRMARTQEAMAAELRDYRRGVDEIRTAVSLAMYQSEILRRIRAALSRLP